MTRILTTAVTVVLTAASASANNVWLSTAATIPPGSQLGELPTIVHTPPWPAAQQIHVWGRPDPGDTLANISFNIRATNPDVLNFTGVTVHNPVLSTIPVTGTDIRRYERTIDSIASEVPISDDPDFLGWFGGYTVLNAVVIGAGMGPTTSSTDPLYDEDHDAWLIATVNYDVTGAGRTDLFLQIGDPGITDRHGQSINEETVFGDVLDPSLNGNWDRQVDSLTADAVVWAVPEPATCWLAFIGTLGFVLCRRSAGARARRPTPCARRLPDPRGYRLLN